MVAVVATLAATTAPVAMGAPGDLDTSYGQGGFVSGNIGTEMRPATVGDFAIAPDGGIFVGGASQSFLLARFDEVGALDPNFGDGGFVFTDFDYSILDRVSGVVVQPDGKVVLAGSSQTSGSPSDFAVARYKANGELDPSFSSDGRLTTDFGGAEQGKDVLLQADGKLVVAGWASVAGVTSMAIARYESDGDLDETFNGDGKAIIEFEHTSTAQTVALSATGDVIVGGQSGGDSALARLTPGGELDQSFGDGDGILTTDFGAADVAHGLAIQPDGKLTMAGEATYSTPQSFRSDLVLARYEPDGDLDSAFGDGGRVREATGGTYGGGLRSLALQADGGIVGAGNTGHGDPLSSVPTNELTLYRFDPDGTADASFGSDGAIHTGTVTLEEPVRVALDDDGNIVAAGTHANGLAVFRYDDQGEPDEGFGSDGGTVEPAIGRSSDLALDVVVMPDGSRIALVETRARETDKFALVKQLASGDPDPAFGGGDGVALVELGEPKPRFVRDLEVRPDGSMVVVSSTETNDFLVVGLTAGGVLDPAFGGGDGRVETDLGGSDYATSVAAASDGSLTVAGYSISDASRFAIARYTPTGLLDESFDGDGIMTTAFPNETAAFGAAIAWQSADRVIAVGGSQAFLLAGYDDLGLDTSFGCAGTVVDQAAGSRAEAIAMASDRRIVAFGRGHLADDLVLARYTARGARDRSLGGDGAVATPLPGGVLATPAGVVIQPDGRIVAGATVGEDLATAADFGVIRYEPDGTLDNAFGDSGVSLAGVRPGTVERLEAIALEPSGEIIAAGGSDDDWVLARYIGTGGDPASDTPGPDAAALGCADSRPDTRIVSFSTKPGRGTARFAFRARGDAGGVAFECRLDGARFRPCRSPKRYRSLKPGTHTFRVRAVAAGKADPSPAKRRFKI